MISLLEANHPRMDEHLTHLNKFAKHISPNKSNFRGLIVFQSFKEICANFSGKPSEIETLIGFGIFQIQAGNGPRSYRSWPRPDLFSWE